MGEKVNEAARVLCVDLDGTLVKTDLLQESLCAFLRKNPFRLLLVLLWLCRGRAFLKRKLAQRVSLAPALLPYNLELLDFLISEQRAGRRLVLATASDKLLAGPVAEHLGIFSEVLGSDGETNLRGLKKLALLQSKFGEHGFDYIGNSRVDLPLWQAAGEALVVSSSARLIALAKSRANVSRVFKVEGRLLWAAFKALRPHQWVKNLLVFVAPVMGQKVFEADVIQGTCLAFAAFCACSSSAYLINDLVDIESDRGHKTKQHRPLAAGTLPLLYGAALVPLLLLTSAFVACWLPAKFCLALGVYLLVTILYSFALKQIAIVDIVTLAGLYTLRILAGGYAVSVDVSPWLRAFSMFIFLSLACVKRFSELYRLRQSNGTSAKGRGYVPGDMEMVSQFGAASGYISVLVLALYINSEEVTRFYSHQRELWLICPLLLYWVGRVWLLAHRGELLEDPIVFALKDKASYLVGAMAGLIMILAL